MDMISFFSRSEAFDYMVLRPLSHIRGNWELTWDDESKQYKEEDGSYAGIVNELLTELGQCRPPDRYHDNEDRLAEYVVKSLGWTIHKVNNRWVGMDYSSILEHGGFRDVNENNLVLATAGRVQAAIARGQNHFDDMEESHQRMLAAVMSIILYHRGG